MKRRSRVARLAVPAILALLICAAPAEAAEFAVDSAADSASDPLPNNGCEAIGGDECTLREAIEAANATPTGSPAEEDQIPIAVTGDIFLQSELPPITTRTTITGPGPENLTVQRAIGANIRIFYLDGAANGDAIRIQDLTISGGAPRDNVGPLHGGGVFVDLGGLNFLENVVVTGNTASTGGGIWSGNGATLDVIDSTIVDNQAQREGGGIHSAGGLTLDSSTLVMNRTTGAAGFGGGLWSGEVSMHYALVRNSTFVGNSATGFGGGLHVSNGPVFLESSTITGNTADSADGASGNGGGISITPNGSRIANTVLTGNFRGTATPVANQCTLGSGSTLTSDGYNLVGTSDPGCTAFFNNDQVGGDPMLGPLGDYGGPTETIPLLPGSPAINMGNPATPSDMVGAYPACRTTDQRGFPRGGAEGRCDVGAFEGVLLPPIPGSGTPPLPPPTATAGRRPKCKKGRKLVRRKGKLRCKKKKRRR